MKCGSCHGRHETAAEVKNCYARKDWRNRSLDETQAKLDAISEPTVKRSAIPAHLRPDTQLASTRDWDTPTYTGAKVMDGTYAVMLNNDPKQVTIRFHVLTMGPRKGIQVVDYLMGPDNESDWTRFANWVDGGYRVFNKFLSSERLVNALVLMMEADRETLMTAGEGYALRSKRCWVCFHKLTVGESIIRGMGPVCADKMGVA